MWTGLNTDVVTFSRSGLVDLIFSIIHWDSTRGGHTTESLLIELRRMDIINPYASGPRFSSLQVRLIIAGLLQSGQLDMRSDGILIMPESSPDPTIEHYQGAWYLTTPKGNVLGPFASELEANNAYSIHTKRA